MHVCCPGRDFHHLFALKSLSTLWRKDDLQKLKRFVYGMQYFIDVFMIELPFAYKNIWNIHTSKLFKS